MLQSEQGFCCQEASDFPIIVVGGELGLRLIPCVYGRSKLWAQIHPENPTDDHGRPSHTGRFHSPGSRVT